MVGTYDTIGISLMINSNDFILNNIRKTNDHAHEVAHKKYNFNVYWPITF